MWDWIGANANSLLVVVGTAGVAVALLTIWAIWRQTDVGKEAAKAALLNIQAFINSERPWISIKVELSKRWIGSFDIVALNNGRTPAMIISHAEAHLFIEVFMGLPDVPEYGKPDDRSQIVLPGESISICEIIMLEALRNKETLAKFKSLELEGYIFGTISYRDLLGPSTSEPHETRWCFHILPGDDLGGLYLFEHRWAGDAYLRHT